MFKWRPLRLIRVLICCPVTKQERENRLCATSVLLLLRVPPLLGCRATTAPHAAPCSAAPLRTAAWHAIGRCSTSLPTLRVAAPSSVPASRHARIPARHGRRGTPLPPNEEGREGRRRWEERHEILGEESEGKRRQKERDKWIKKCRKKNHQLVDAAAIRCLR